MDDKWIIILSLSLPVYLPPLFSLASFDIKMMSKMKYLQLPYKTNFRKGVGTSYTSAFHFLHHIGHHQIKLISFFPLSQFHPGCVNTYLIFIYIHFPSLIGWWKKLTNTSWRWDHFSLSLSLPHLSSSFSSWSSVCHHWWKKEEEKKFSFSSRLNWHKHQREGEREKERNSSSLLYPHHLQIKGMTICTR